MISLICRVSTVQGWNAECLAKGHSHENSIFDLAFNSEESGKTRFRIVYLKHEAKQEPLPIAAGKPSVRNTVFVAFVEDNATMSSIQYSENRVSYFVQNPEGSKPH